MAGLHFDITADNSNFIRNVNEIKTSVSTASNALQKLGEDFDISSIKNKIAALNQVIKDNQVNILKASSRIQKWEEDARQAFNDNDFETFEAINKDIEDQKQKIVELTADMEQYADTLKIVMASSGQGETTDYSATKLFTSEHDYQYAEQLRAKVEELQNQIANFKGNDEDLAPLQQQLNDTATKLYALNTAAAQTAAELGERLGSRAAEASTTLYQLNAAVEKQEQTLSSLKSKLQETATEFENLKSNENDSQAVENASIQYDILSQSVANAEQKLAMLKAAQADASMEWQNVSNEIEQHDSIMVKMLGGYENYTAIVSKLPAPLQGVIAGISGMTGAAKAFIATPLGAIIAAIVIALQTVTSWFHSSREGQLAFAEASGYLSGILGQLKEVVIAVGKAIYKAFSDPKKAVTDLWNSIKTNIVNRVEAVGGVFKSLGGVISKALQFKWNEAGEEFKKLANNAATAATGVKDVGDKLSQATDKLKNWGKTVQDNAKANARLSVEEKQIQIDEADMRLKNSEREVKMNELRGKMYSTNKEESSKAIEQYRKLSEEQMNAELAIQKRKLEHRRELNSLTSSTIEDENAEKELERGLNQIEAAHKARMAMLQRRENRLNSSSGQTASQLLSKTAAEEQQVTDLLKKQAEERLRQQQAYEYELWQNRIDLMDEGEAKLLAQMRLDNAKELTALKERQEQEIQAEIANQKALFDAREDVNASKDKKYAKKVFNPEKDVDISSIDAINERYTQLYADLEAKQAKAEQDQLDAAKESMNAYLQEFGNYQQKRLAIQEEYETKIAEAQNAGQRMQLMAQRNQKISDLDFNEWQDNGGMSLAFGDVSKLSKETITQLIRDMEQYREKVIATFDPDKIQKYEEALNNLRLAEASDSFFDDVNGINEALRERISLTKQIADEEAKTTELENQKANLEWQLRNLGITPTPNTAAIGPDGQPTETTPLGMSEEDIRISEELRVKLDEVNNLLTQSANNTARLRSNLSQSQKVKFADVKKFASNLLSAGKNAAELASIFGDELADAIETGVNSLETMLDSFEEIGSSINRLADAGKEAVNTTVDASKEIVEGASAGMQASAAATATSLSTMEKASAILAIIGAAIQVATLVASLFNSDKKHEKNIEKLQDRIDSLQKSYDRLGKSASEAFSSDAAKLIEQQEALTRQQIGLVQLQMQEEKAKKKSDKDKIKDYQDTIDDLYEQLDELQDKAEEAIFGEDISSAIENFASAYSSAWEDGESRVASARDTVRKMMRQMVEESIKAAIQSSGAMDNIRRKLMDFYADGILTTTEQDYIYGLADELQKELDARFGAQGDLLSGSYSQNPTSGGWDTMSQDSADALNGRFTALAETGENIRAINAGIAENITATLSVANLQRELMQEALNIHIINMGHLETISKNTRELAAMRENLDKIERYVRNI